MTESDKTLNAACARRRTFPLRRKDGEGFLKGAAVISAGGFLSKLLGAVYRIPLVAFLGGEGMGLYQLVYPLYCILLTVSAGGIPTGIARIISSGGAGAEKRAFYLYGGIGLIGSLVMFAMSSPLAAAQGERGVALCCKLLSPSVFFVATLSVVRGYFQGKGDMFPTAFSEVTEQAVKVAFGVILAGRFRGDAVSAAAAAIFAVTVSEVITCLICIILYIGSRKGVKPLFNEGGVSSLNILAYTLPLAFTAVALPVSQLMESMAVVNILRGSSSDATALYGIFSGCAITIVNLPVSVTYGLAAATVPHVAPLASQGDITGAMQKIRRSILYTAAISLPCAVALYIFAPQAAGIIFPSLTHGQKKLLVTLVRVMSVNAFTSSLAQTSSACITSLGRPAFSMLSQWSAAFLRIGLSSALVAFTPLSVVGAAYSANICYLFAVVINLCYIIGIKNKSGDKNVNNTDRFRGRRRGFNTFG